MKLIMYKDSEKLGLRVVQETMGYTVIRIAPKVKVRKSHGHLYPQFFNGDLETAYQTMLTFLNNI